VSGVTAAAMAAGARAELGADIAVADTGIAGPDGGTREKPIGLVYLAVDGPDGSRTAEFRLSGDREGVRTRTAALALHMLRRTLARSDTKTGESER
jgi:PncC family amidohydrolase